MDSRADSRYISIHALRGEGDHLKRPRPPQKLCFNPRPPRGGRQYSVSVSVFLPVFQSTPSVGRATCGFCRVFTPHFSVSIHALRGEGDIYTTYKNNAKIVSIHALRGEGDSMPERKGQRMAVSIHALRGEGDPTAQTAGCRDQYFNPRPPWEGRLNGDENVRLL